MSDEPKIILGYKTYQRMERMLDLILKWEPNWRPDPYSGPFSIVNKLESMGLWDTFMEYERNRKKIKSVSDRETGEKG